MSKVIKIGTRDSKLAMWQANTVASQLQKLGYKTQLVPVKSEGDLVLDKPLYEMGITGVFTKTLDLAMLDNKIDIAVHSMKDVPTALPQGIVQGAVLKREEASDILVYREDVSFLTSDQGATIATGSLRRKAQWLNKYPEDCTVDLRGNVITRLEKLDNSDWQGAIFASAGLKRIGLMPKKHVDLDWMIPAPAQGAMVVVVKAEDNFCFDAVTQLNDYEAEMTTHIERQFLRTLEGGCSAPIGALAIYDEKSEQIDFKGVLLSLDGKQKIEVHKTVALQQWKKLGFLAAKEILDQSGGAALMASIKENLSK